MKRTYMAPDEFTSNALFAFVLLYDVSYYLQLFIPGLTQSKTADVGISAAHNLRPDVKQCLTTLSHRQNIP